MTWELVPIKLSVAVKATIFMQYSRYKPWMETSWIMSWIARTNTIIWIIVSLKGPERSTRYLPLTSVIISSILYSPATGLSWNPVQVFKNLETSSNCGMLSSLK